MQMTLFPIFVFLFIFFCTVFFFSVLSLFFNPTFPFGLFSFILNADPLQLCEV